MTPSQDPHPDRARRRFPPRATRDGVALALASAALFSALGGPAQAARLFGAKDIARSAITSKHVKDGSLSARDLRRGTLPSAIPGAAGAAGLAGPAGAPGDAGPRGERGLAGVTGSDGAAGERGAVGQPGDRGATGPLGPAGPAGPKGLQGAAGPVGDKGPLGDKGPVGARGPQGAAGARGQNHYAVKESSTSGTGQLSHTTWCEVGKVAIAGGFLVEGPHWNDVRLGISRPVSSTAGDLRGWNVLAQNNGTGSWQLKVRAVCVRVGSRL